MSSIFKKVESDQEVIFIFKNLCTIIINYETLNVELITSEGKMFFDIVSIDVFTKSIGLTSSVHKPFWSSNKLTIYADNGYTLDLTYRYFHVHHNAYKHLFTAFDRLTVMKFLLRLDSQKIVFYDGLQCCYYAEKDKNNIPTLFSRVTISQKQNLLNNFKDNTFQLKNFNIYLNGNKNIFQIIATGKKEIIINTAVINENYAFSNLNGFENLDFLTNSIEFYTFKYYNSYLKQDTLQSIRLWNQLPIKSCPITVIG